MSVFSAASLGRTSKRLYGLRVPEPALSNARTARSSGLSVRDVTLATMLLEVTRLAQVAAPPTAAWALLRDIPRLSGCIPNLGQLRVLETDRRYAAVVSDRLGPFRLEVPVQIEVTSVEEGREIVAELSGNDARGQARVRGTLRALVEPRDDGAALHLDIRLDVLGRLAALGATPMRRRADEVFT